MSNKSFYVCKSIVNVYERDSSINITHDKAELPFPMNGRFYFFQLEARRNASLRYHRKKCENQATQLKLHKWTDANVIKYLGRKLNKQTLEFIKMQISNCDKKENGRRYNSHQKNLALAMYKQGPKSYRFLRRMFILPVKNTVASHCAHLLIRPGIDPKLMKLIKEKVDSFSEIDKYCMLTWDEISLRPHLDYSPSRDVIDGFVGIELRHPIFATHSLTFMIRGINTPYKQPTAHYYNSNLSTFELAKYIKEVTDAVFDAGNISFSNTLNTRSYNIKI